MLSAKDSLIAELHFFELTLMEDRRIKNTLPAEYTKRFRRLTDKIEEHMINLHDILESL